MKDFWLWLIIVVGLFEAPYILQEVLAKIFAHREKMAQIKRQGKE